MAEEQTAKVIDAAEIASRDGLPRRQMSSIEFPYGDLDDAIQFARAISSVGGQSCSLDQVAAYLKQAPTSGAFRLRQSYPRVFGLTETERGAGRVRLTTLGLRIIDAKQEAAARVDAFLHVPLYKAIYEKYKGYTLPPAAALEREMASMGVSSKQTDKARQAFERSARQAGFHWAGADRLVVPAIPQEPPGTRPLDPGTPGAEGERKPKHGGGSGGDEPPDRTELVQMLLRYLPDKQLTNDQLARWLRAAEVNLRMAYDVSGSIKVEVVPEGKDPLNGKAPSAS